MATTRTLLTFAKDSEDVASGLHSFRDGLPRSADRITGIIAELFAVSGVLRGISNSTRLPSRVEDDLVLVFPTLRRTFQRTLDMFAQSRNRSLESAWQDLCDRMERDEGIGLRERLKWYHDFLQAQQDVVNGYCTRDLGSMRRNLVSLLDTQEHLDEREQRRAITPGPSTTPRPQRPQRPIMHRTETPRSPTAPNVDWQRQYRRASMAPPVAPEAPQPTSPTFTSSSSQTLNSSQTSYSSDTAFAPSQPSYLHWAQDVFDGQNPGTPFADSDQLDERSLCHGTIDDGALDSLVRDGFIKVLELSFDPDSLRTELYFRPSDSRARILVITENNRGEQCQYSQPLTNLKVIRKGSMLQLCRLRREGKYRLWANLNFALYERMVLFYCTFVAMKRQDTRGVEHEDLLDRCELEGRSDNDEEEVIFASNVKDGRMLHALRLYKDRASGVVRLEACAARGPMENVPLWTAFVTRYSNNGDLAWAQFEGNGVVSLAALRTPPYVFLAGYEPPRNQQREYVLQFVNNKEAGYFIENWSALCR